MDMPSIWVLESAAVADALSALTCAVLSVVSCVEVKPANWLEVRPAIAEVLSTAICVDDKLDT